MTVPSVVDGELIEAVWGNTVATDVNTHSRQLAGTQACGPLILPGTQSSNANSATRRGYVDSVVAGATQDFVQKSGSTMSGLLILPAASDSGGNNAAMRKAWITGQIDSAVGTRLPIAGGAMQGNLNMQGNRIVGLSDPANPQDATTRAWVNGQINELQGQINDLKGRVTTLENKVETLENKAHTH